MRPRVIEALPDVATCRKNQPLGCIGKGVINLDMTRLSDIETGRWPYIYPRGKLIRCGPHGLYLPVWMLW